MFDGITVSEPQASCSTSCAGRFSGFGALQLSMHHACGCYVPRKHQCSLVSIRIQRQRCKRAVAYELNENSQISFHFCRIGHLNHSMAQVGSHGTYHIVVWGSTGLVGRLISRHIAQNYQVPPRTCCKPAIKKATACIRLVTAFCRP